MKTDIHTHTHTDHDRLDENEIVPFGDLLLRVCLQAFVERAENVFALDQRDPHGQQIGIKTSQIRQSDHSMTQDMIRATVLQKS